MLQVKDSKIITNTNACVFGHIKAYYGCYETTKKVAYISIHYCGSTIPQIPTH
jgi:hypothetical protein